MDGVQCIHEPAMPGFGNTFANPHPVNDKDTQHDLEQRRPRKQRIGRDERHEGRDDDRPGDGAGGKGQEETAGRLDEPAFFHVIVHVRRADRVKWEGGHSPKQRQDQYPRAQGRVEHPDRHSDHGRYET